MKKIKIGGIIYRIKKVEQLEGDNQSAWEVTQYENAHISIRDKIDNLMMPVSTRELYFELGINADDDGVVEAFNVLRLVNASEDDLKVLATKGFVQILNKNLVTYIADWNSNIDIMENIWTYINKAKIVICDLSCKNPNVYYELGIANTIGKDVIPICDEESFHEDYKDKLPFDIMLRNVLFYKNTAVGSEKFIDDLKKTVKAIIEGHPVISTN
ncbi:MAG: hypothetical protein ABF575_00145 [Liquorilactobacillus hordei]|uniref:hypothetical protein n=1 Tax=Liquorilactobacillus hordei TaxID=468911 RepID=UPI0039EBA064